MKNRLPTLILIALAAALAVVACAEEKKSTAAPKSDTKAMSTEKPEVVKSDEEWMKKLTPEQFRITRLRGTERAYGEAYENFKKEGEGTYYCVCCGAELFTSATKFDSHCGWPSFYDPSKAKNVLEKPDNSHGMRRIETVCKRCDAHLGHVFEGEGFGTPTDRRFCINGVALHFVPKGGAAPKLEAVASAAVQEKKEKVAKEGGVEVKKEVK
jgi:peptide-methionine (R)-S-oxide reductase